MITKRTRFLLVCLLSLAMLLSCCGLVLKTVAAEETEPDHKVAYYVQGYKGYGTNNKVEWTELPTGIGIKTLPNQYNTNSRFNNSGNDSPQAYDLFFESETGDYGGDGNLWGLYYFEGIQHDSYGSAVVEEDDPLYETPFKSVVSTGSEEWGANQPVIYKFEMPDTVTEYDVVIGANAYVLGNAGWGNGAKRTNEVYINDNAEPSGYYGNTYYCNYTEIHNVKAAEETCADGTARNILTIKIQAAEGGSGPAVSFVSIADASSAEPAYLADECTTVNLNVDATSLPSSVEVLTTAGMKSVPVVWTDTSAFDNKDNRYLLNSVTVTGKVTVSGCSYDISVPVRFIEDEVYYYMNSSFLLGDNKDEPLSVNQTFAAMLAANESTMLNDVMFREASADVWGAVSGTYTFMTWEASTLYSDNPYSTITKTDYTEFVDGTEMKGTKYRFLNLPEGKYTIYIGANEPLSWGTGGSRTMQVYANDSKIGEYTTLGQTNALGKFTFTQESADEILNLALYSPSDGEVFVGFIVIAAYEEPSSDVNYGDDTDQLYFFNAGDANGSRVDGIGRPYYQTSFNRAFNEPNGGEVLRDETGVAWGYYYNENMASGYYAVAGNAGNSPFDSMLYTNIDAADREMIFKFEIPEEYKDKTFDIVIGFYECAWGGGNGDHRGANVYINHETAARVTVTNLSYKTAAFIGGVAAEAKDSDTGLDNVITVRLTKASADSVEPVVNFISIRETGNTPIYLSDCTACGAVDIDAAALPVKTNVLTTAGIEEVDVAWTDLSGFNDENGKYFMNIFEAAGSVVYGGKTREINAKFAYIDAENVYYYIDTTLIEDSGLFYLPPVAQAAFDAMKSSSPFMLNDVPDGKSVNGSWGNTNVNDIRYYYGYNESPYRSIVESTEVEAGENYLMYRFPNLPAGEYLVQIGLNDPWGPRASNVFMNGVSLGVFNSVTGTDKMMSFMFTQAEDNAAAELYMTGVDGQLAGFIVIRKIDAADEAVSISVSTNANNYFFRQGDSIDLTGLTILVDMGGYEFIRTVSEDMISGYDANKLGLQTITITYGGKTASYNVTVLEKKEDGAENGDKKNGGCSSTVAAVPSVAISAAFAVAACALLVRSKQRNNRG